MLATPIHAPSLSNDFAPTASKHFVLDLPTDSSPIPAYTHLIQLYKSDKLWFANVVTSNMDENVGLPCDHCESYRTFMLGAFFGHSESVSYHADSTVESDQITYTVDITPSQVRLVSG